MDDTAKARLAADEARTTFNRIKQLRKTMPTNTAKNRDALDKAIADEQADWWARTKHLFAK